MQAMQCFTGCRQVLLCLVSTGRSVSQQYAAARDEARNHARVRNAYFQQVRHQQVLAWGSTRPRPASYQHPCPRDLITFTAKP
jgi:hypothetical protein